MMKANPNYEASAVNLVNPAPVVSDLQLIKEIRANITLLEEKRDACIPKELKDALIDARANLDRMVKNIKVDIDAYGSYQDTETGEYALKQRRESITYRPDLVIQHLSAKLADLVIIKAVDSKALDGLVKGGLVTAKEARACGEVKDTFAYIIR